MRVVLLGGDLNAYSVAVSFHETYGVKSTVFCRYRCGITATSSIVDIRVVPQLLDDEIGTEALLDFAGGSSEKPYLIPCGDWYVCFLDRNRDSLGNAYKFLIPPHEILESVTEKKNFYRMLKKEELPHPKTVILSKDKLSLTELLSIGEYPAVLKPSNSTVYYAHPFPDMQKVYFPKNPKEALAVAERIFLAGYSGDLILQKKIGKDKDTAVAKTLTLCMDLSGRARRGVLGEVLVEEEAPGARGNYAAILSRPPDALTCRIVSFLEKIRYVGVANIDILSDDSGSYILELNPRQGRSADYLRAAGISLAAFLVDAIEEKGISTDLSSKVSLWHAVPLPFVMRSVRPEVRKLLARLKKEGRVTSAFSYRRDRSTVRRQIYVQLHAMRRIIALIKTKEKTHECNP